MVTYFSKGKVFHKAKMVTFKKVMFFFRQKSRAGEPGVLAPWSQLKKKTGARAGSALKKKVKSRSQGWGAGKFFIGSGS